MDNLVTQVEFHVRELLEVQVLYLIVVACCCLLLLVVAATAAVADVAVAVVSDPNVVHYFSVGFFKFSCADRNISNRQETKLKVEKTGVNSPYHAVAAGPCKR